MTTNPATAQEPTMPAPVDTNAARATLAVQNALHLYAEQPGIAGTETAELLRLLATSADAVLQWQVQGRVLSGPCYDEWWDLNAPTSRAEAEEYAVRGNPDWEYRLVPVVSVSATAYGPAGDVIVPLRAR
jgi:hypothetical protein